MSFAGRIKQHDEIAIPMVMERFKTFGFECFKMGTEIDDEKLQQALRAQHDDTSLMMRFRPDKIVIKHDERALLCEVKSEKGRYPNFAVEMDSYIAATLWNAISRNVMHSFVDLGNSSISCCWLNEIPKPALIKIPRRKGFPTAIRRAMDRLPDIPWKTVKKTGGSGTPYFFVPKSAPYLTEFNAFVVAELLT